MSFDENPIEKNEPEVVKPQDGQFVEVEPIQAVSAAPVANVPDSTPMYGEPVNSGEAPSFDTPLSGEPPKKSNKKIWIIVAVVLVLLCCCCIVVVLGFSSLMDTPEFQDMLEDYMNLIQTVPAYASAWLAA